MQWCDKEFIIIFAIRKEMNYSVSFWYNLLEIEPWNRATVMLLIMLLKSNGKWTFIPMVRCPIVSQVGFGNKETNMIGVIYGIILSSFMLSHII